MKTTTNLESKMNVNDENSNNSTASAGASASVSSRRQFLQKGTSAVAAGGVFAATSTPSLSLARSAHSSGSDRIKLGLIGAGNRGAGAVCQAMNTDKCQVELHAIADAFSDRLEETLQTCKEEHEGKVFVPAERQFVGFDGYQKVIDSDVDMVILATPPGFRPLHFETAIEAGKHVFMEKPVAVDAPGIRRVLAAGEKAKEKNLAVQVGLQRRHERAYRETIEKLKGGIIGDMNFSRVYWNSGGVWCKSRNPSQSELEYQMRNWYYFNWLCGDHIVEQHIHNMDVINWLLDDYPVKAQGQGGRLVRNDIDHGEIYDHHMVEYTYANGHKMLSQCRHIKGCWGQVGEYVHGAKGYANIEAGRIFDNEGNEIFKCKEGKGQRGGHQQEHYDLFEDLANGKIPNETEYGAKSTMTAILGRLATYSGKELQWDDAIASEISLADVDSLKTMADLAPLTPDENLRYAIARPGDSSVVVIDWKPGKKRS
jgi:predicted dehydrogenase